MTIDPANLSGPAGNIVERAKGILINPPAEWEKIETEAAEPQQLYLTYALPLIVLSALCALVGAVVFGYSAFGVTYKPSLVNAIVESVLQVGLQLGGMFLIAFVTNALAPHFGAQQNMGQAHKLAVYGMTAAFLAGVFALFPPLRPLAIVGLYSLYLIYVGLPRLMKGPEDKRIGYFLSIIGICIVVALVISAVLGGVRSSLGGLGGTTYQVGQQQSPEAVTMPNGASVDVASLEQQVAALQNASSTPAIDPARLQRFLPRTLAGGFTQSSSSTATAMSAAHAEATYENGDQRIDLTISHLGGLGAVAALAQAADMQQSNTSADGFTRTSTIDGRTIIEDVSASRGTASYAVFGDGVAIAAEGSGGVSLDQVRAIVDTINVARVEGQFD